MKPTKYRFIAVRASQARDAQVFTFAAKAKDVLAICEISRAGRSQHGQLFGFQRPQIAAHIQEIRDYLESKDAVLPNSIVVGFLGGLTVTSHGNGAHSLTVTVTNSKPGFVVDGQQRLTALSESDRDAFEIFVSCVVCRSAEELRRQFILINNTRPLPKSLIYELLPSVTALPRRLGSRAFAAGLVERLNYADDSSLKNMVLMHTNPKGFIKDTSLQKVIMNSTDTGALREHISDDTRPDFGFELVNNFFSAVQEVFAADWVNQSPRTSRLVHGAGIVAMGYVMEMIVSLSGSHEKQEFIRNLKALRQKCAWTSGQWRFSDGSVVRWNEIENTPRQIQKLALHLVSLTKKSFKATPRGSKSLRRKRR